MRTSSPVPDTVMAEPLRVPNQQPIDDKDVKNENEFAALGTSKKYPAIVAHIRERQEYYRNYMPDGKAVVNLSNEEAGAWWKCAATMIAEYEAFMNIIEVSTDAVRQSGRG